MKIVFLFSYTCQVLVCAYAGNFHIYHFTIRIIYNLQHTLVCSTFQSCSQLLNIVYCFVYSFAKIVIRSYHHAILSTICIFYKLGCCFNSKGGGAIEITSPTIDF